MPLIASCLHILSYCYLCHPIQLRLAIARLARSGELGEFADFSSQIDVGRNVWFIMVSDSEKKA
jgi:hypothetical protein